MKDFPGFEKPNSVDVPLELLYGVIFQCVTHMSEMKVLLYIAAKTYSFNKWWDWISLSQFEYGQDCFEWDDGCGLSHASILDGLKRAEEHGFIICRCTCPSCKNVVTRGEVEQRRWKNRYGEGVTEVAIVPEICPFCQKPLRGQERPEYRLRFKDEVLEDYRSPREFMAKYQGTQVEKPGSESDTQVEKSSSEPDTQVEKSSSDAEKLENSTSPSTLPSTKELPTTKGAAGAAARDVEIPAKSDEQVMQEVLEMPTPIAFILPDPEANPAIADPGKPETVWLEMADLWSKIRGSRIPNGREREKHARAIRSVADKYQATPEVVRRAIERMAADPRGEGWAFYNHPGPHVEPAGRALGDVIGKIQLGTPPKGGNDHDQSGHRSSWRDPVATADYSAKPRLE
jgi:hypothetical protein